MSEARMQWEGREYEVFHQTVRSLRRVNEQTPGSSLFMLAMADMAGEMVPDAVETIEGLTLDQLDAFIGGAVAALNAADPFTETSGGN